MNIDPIEYRLVPKVQLAVCLLSLFGALMCGAWGIPNLGGGDVVGVLVFSVLAIIFGVLIYFRRGQLQVGAMLGYRRGKMAFELPLTAAESIRIRRPLWPLQRPTDYALNVRIGARTYLLPFAEHWLSGQVAMARAQTLAAQLAIPVEDPRGEQFRQSPVFFLRWMGSGSEWKVLLMIGAFGSALGGGAIVLQ